MPGATHLSLMAWPPWVGGLSLAILYQRKQVVAWNKHQKFIAVLSYWAFSIQILSWAFPRSCINHLRNPRQSCGTKKIYLCRLSSLSNLRQEAATRWTLFSVRSRGGPWWWGAWSGGSFSELLPSFHQWGIPGFTHLDILFERSWIWLDDLRWSSVLVDDGQLVEDC